MTRGYVLAAALLLVAAAFVAGVFFGDHYRSTVARADKSDAEASAAKTTLRRTEIVAGAQATHAQRTQENSDAFTQGQPARDAVARADLDRVERLLVGAEKRAATYAAMSKANAEACSGAADRLAALDAHIVRGGEVVAALRRDLGRRDAEVVLLWSQLQADQALAATQ